MSNTKDLGGVDSPVKASGGPGFVHLHVHSAYSLLEGAVPLSRLVDLAFADGQPALAVTDRNNLFGALEFSEKASGKGIQPIMGAKLAVDFDDGADRKPRSGLVEFGCLVLLAMDEAGFSNLSRLVSKAHLDAGTDKASGPHVPFADLVGTQPWPDRPDRRPGRAGGPVGAGWASAASARADRCAATRIRGPALCRIAAPRR